MKKFMSNQELICYLLSKNLIINDKEKALQCIEKYSYYSIINGYKAVFKNEDNSFKKNTSFEEIFSLYEFDKNIKFIFLKHILEIEVVIKSLVANTIAEKYGVEDYLKSEYLDNTANEIVVKEFIEKVKKDIDDNYIKHPAIISAHSDRLYSYRNKYDISFKSIEKDYNRKEYLCNLYMIIKSMKVLLDEEKYQEFEDLLNKEIEKLNKKLIVIDIKCILRIMGYDV